MKHFKWFIALMTLAIAFSMGAQGQYHAGVLYGLKGNVKEIKAKSENPLVNGKTKFIENGMKKLSLLTYNAEGYPIGCSTQGWGNNYKSISIAYNEQHLPSTVEIKDNTKKGLSVMTFAMEYDSSGNLSECVLKSVPAGEEASKAVSTETVFQYSDYTFDPQGNWISRVCRQEKKVDGKIIDAKTYTETREIKYF